MNVCAFTNNPNLYRNAISPVALGLMLMGCKYKNFYYQSIEKINNIDLSQYDLVIISEYSLAVGDGKREYFVSDEFIEKIKFIFSKKLIVVCNGNESMLIPDYIGKAFESLTFVSTIHFFDELNALLSN